MHWTYTKHIVGLIVYFLPRKAAKNKNSQKNWFNTNFEAIIQIIQNVVLALLYKSDVWNSPAANSCISLQLFLLMEHQIG